MSKATIQPVRSYKMLQAVILRMLQAVMFPGLVNVPIQHHPTTADIISNKPLKVMFKIPRRGHQSQPLDLPEGNDHPVTS